MWNMNIITQYGLYDYVLVLGLGLGLGLEFGHLHAHVPIADFTISGL